MSQQKNLYIRSHKDTYDLAHAIAKEESRSLNKQIIHMVHDKAKELNISVEKKKEPIGLHKLAETRQLDSETG